MVLDVNLAKRKIMGAAARLRATAPTIFHTDLTILTIRLL